jgi:maleate isomerase
MSNFAYEMTDRIGTSATLGLVVLQSDETIEHDFRRLLPVDGVVLHTSRVPSGLEVTGDTLAEMRNHLPAAAGLMPRSVSFDVVGYGCTSGTSVIGPSRVARLIGEGCETRAVTEPVSGLIAACQRLGVNRLAFLSPYVEEVSSTLRGVLVQGGVQSPVFGSFDEAEERRVARIAPQSVISAALALASQPGTEAIFMSCTNLRTLDVIDEIEARTGKPVLSSNLVLAWHIARLAGIGLACRIGALSRLD